jgi:hypothetical protein
MDPEQTFLRVHARVSGVLARLLTPKFRAVLEYLCLFNALMLLALLVVMHVNFVAQVCSHNSSLIPPENIILGCCMYGMYVECLLVYENARGKFGCHIRLSHPIFRDTVFLLGLHTELVLILVPTSTNEKCLRYSVSTCVKSCFCNLSGMR